MNRRSNNIAWLTSCALAFAWAGAGAQQAESQPPQTSGQQAEPEAASSPHQRETTRTRTTEAPTTSEMTGPEAASSPHQRAATETDSKSERTKVAEAERQLAECIELQRRNDATLSKDAAKKACKEQQRARPEPRG
jgi:cytoskeletal protein RodZ